MEFICDDTVHAAKRLQTSYNSSISVSESENRPCRSRSSRYEHSCLEIPTLNISSSSEESRLCSARRQKRSVDLLERSVPRHLSVLSQSNDNNPFDGRLSRSTRVSWYQKKNIRSLTPCLCVYYTTSSINFLDFSTVHSIFLAYFSGLRIFFCDLTASFLWRIRIREKMLQFSSTVLPAPSLYLLYLPNSKLKYKI